MIWLHKALTTCLPRKHGHRPSTVIRHRSEPLLGDLDITPLVSIQPRHTTIVCNRNQVLRHSKLSCWTSLRDIEPPLHGKSEVSKFSPGLSLFHQVSTLARPSLQPPAKLGSSEVRIFLFPSPKRSSNANHRCIHQCRS